MSHLIESLSRKTSEYENKLDFPRWIDSEDESVQQILNYCYDCVQKEIKKLSEKHSEFEYFMGGGDLIYSDSPLYCSCCKNALDYSLDDYGVVEEFEFYSSLTNQELLNILKDIPSSYNLLIFLRAIDLSDCDHKRFFDRLTFLFF